MDAVQEDAADVLRECRAKFVHLIPPPSTLGGRAANASHRLSAFLHSLHLVAGDFQTLRLLLSKLVSITTDLGVESLLTRLQPFALSQMLPFFDPVSQPAMQSGPLEDTRR